MHCSDTPPGMDIGAAEIREWHLERDFIDIGYHWVIPRNGSLEHGRPADTIGAHTYGYNATSVGVCLVGRDSFTEAQWITLHHLVSSLRETYPDAEVCGHNEFSHKACPGFNVKDWWGEDERTRTSGSDGAVPEVRQQGQRETIRDRVRQVLRYLVRLLGGK